MKAYISRTEYYLPEKVLRNEDLTKDFPEWSTDKISKKTGIYQRRIAADNEFSSDMAFKAAELLFENYDRSKVDFIIFCTQSPDYFLPTTACILQDRLSLSKNCGAFDFNLGCSGYVYGLGIAKGLICSEQAKNVLLLTAETYSKFLHHKDKSNRTIFGDAASATLISSENGGGEIKHFIHGTDGSGAESLMVKGGGMRYRNIEKEEFQDEFGNIKSNHHLSMDGRDIFNFTIREIPTLINNTLLKNQLQKEEIDLFIFHQANKFMLNHLRKKLGIETSKFYVFLENCGNTVSSTIPIALKSAQDENLIKKGDNVLFVGFGVGLSMSSTVIKF